MSFTHPLARGGSNNPRNIAAPVKRQWHSAVLKRALVSRATPPAWVCGTRAYVESISRMNAVMSSFLSRFAGSVCGSFERLPEEASACQQRVFVRGFSMYSRTRCAPGGLLRRLAKTAAEGVSHRRHLQVMQSPKQQLDQPPPQTQNDDQCSPPLASLFSCNEI